MRHQNIPRQVKALILISNNNNFIDFIFDMKISVPKQ